MTPKFEKRCTKKWSSLYKKNLWKSTKLEQHLPFMYTYIKNRMIKISKKKILLSSPFTTRWNMHPMLRVWDQDPHPHLAGSGKESTTSFGEMDPDRTITVRYLESFHRLLESLTNTTFGSQWRTGKIWVSFWPFYQRIQIRILIKLKSQIRNRKKWLCALYRTYLVSIDEGKIVGPSRVSLV